MSRAGDLDATPTDVCVNHPRVETLVHCGKCSRPICVRCMVETPVGMRCRACAQLRRLPQFDVGPALLARSTAAGLAASVVSWLLVTYVAFLLFFASILVGVAVSAVMSPLARRRSNRLLEVAAVLDIVAGLIIALAIRTAGEGGVVLVPFGLTGLLVPILIASFVAVVRLR